MLVGSVESSLESTTVQRRKRAYSSGNRLRREMVANRAVSELYISGSSTGSDKAFCTTCLRNVSIEFRGDAEIGCHFSGDHH